jgi:excisionase family DNA binding protein
MKLLDSQLVPITPTITKNETRPPNLYATVDEYADRLHVGRGTVFAWVRDGLPSFKVGRTRRIIVEKADRWLEAGGADRSRKSARAKRPAAAARPSQPPNP